MDPIVQGVIGNAIWSGIKRAILAPSLGVSRALTRKSSFKLTTVCLNHRLYARDEYYLKAFSSGQDVLYVSIMSHSTIKEDMEAYLKSHCQ